LRLLAFFFVVAVLTSGAGLWALTRTDDPAASRRIVVLAVYANAFIGFIGVFIHRRTIARLRWKETEDYLARIRRESAKYQTLMEGAADILLIVDPATGAIVECNAQARAALGATIADAPGGTTIERALMEGELGAFREALQNATRSAGAPVSVPEVRLRAADGRPILADARFVSIDLGTERVTLVSLRDLTPQKEMERQLQIRERLSSIGLLTAGVAHEINNPLEGIGNYLSLLERADVPEETRRHHLEMVRHGFARIRDIVRDLLRFARPATGAGEADLSQVVDRALKLLTYSESFREVKVERVGLDAPLPVVGDSGRLEQVVFNLLLNAAAAMGSKGTITIRARRAKNPQSQADEVELVLQDSGPGIAPADLDRIFDPFFTATNGTGLGLAVSYGIVRAHGGTLSAENAPGGGARFTIRLPWPAAREFPATKVRA
jgi:PAS domain S-box-containing protein